MAKTKRRGVVSKKKDPFPWVLFLFLLGSIYLFWVLPIQLGTPTPTVTFKDAKP